MVTGVAASPKVRLWIFPVLAGIAIFLSFERFNILPALLTLPYFLNGMRTLPLKQKMFAYWLMGVVTNLGGYRWITVVATDFGGLPMPFAFGILLLFCVTNNLNFVLWAYLERFFGEKSNPFIIGTIFIVVEQINPQVFPWHLGTVLDSWLLLYQTADLFGVIGLSFIVMVFIHFPYWLWQNRTQLLGRQKVLFLTQSALFVFVVVYGAWALNKYDNNPKAEGKQVGINLVQSNTRLEKYYGASMSSRERMTEFLGLVETSREAIRAHPDGSELLVWPEGSVHFPILNYQPVFNEVAGLARENNLHVVCGSGEIGEGRKENGKPIYHNTLFFIDHFGKVVGRYRKIVLLAFGEYIPLVDTFPVIEKWLPDTISQFTRGEEKPVFRLRQGVHFLPLICYEDIITGFMNGFEHEKADFVVNITNDGWFGKSDASFLHKQMARPRAVEFRKPMVRALNTGTSHIIDAAGRTIAGDTELYVRTFLNATLHLPAEPPVTLYARVGNIPIYLLIAIVGLIWLRRFVQMRRQRAVI